LSGVSNRAGTDQFVALLGPDTAAAVIDPRRPGPPVVERPAHNGGVAVVGQRDGEALGRASNRAGADQLVALLGPDTVAAGEDPRRPGDRIVGNATHDGGVAVGRQRDGPALLGESDHAGANQLRSLLRELRHRRGAETLDVVADRGYYDSQEILACEAAGITVTLPKPMTSSAMAAGRFGKQDFVYVAADDVYRCPAGERLTYRFTTEEAGKMLRRYWTTACETCALKARCTPGKERRISRWEHEAVLETVQDRLDRNPDKMRVRRQTVEHPFGTIKAWMGATHFQMRRLPKVASEMALHVLAYNMKRVTQILSACGLVAAIRASGAPWQSDEADQAQCAAQGVDASRSRRTDQRRAAPAWREKMQGEVHNCGWGMHGSRHRRRLIGARSPEAKCARYFRARALRSGSGARGLPRQEKRAQIQLVFCSHQRIPKSV
jgi:hypothetical protein